MRVLLSQWVGLSPLSKNISSLPNNPWFQQIYLLYKGVGCIFMIINTEYNKGEKDGKENLPAIPVMPAVSASPRTQSVWRARLLTAS